MEYRDKNGKKIKMFACGIDALNKVNVEMFRSHIRVAKKFFANKAAGLIKSLFSFFTKGR